MTASGIYATYSVVGNTGGLTESGIDKVADAYRQNLANLQRLKKAQSEGAEGAQAVDDGKGAEGSGAEGSH
jgi:hypothetical protein